MIKAHSKKQVSSGWIIWFIGALFYCYNIAVRVYPSTMMDFLMKYFHLNGAEFGLLASSFYLAYVPLLIPVGILVDRFDMRKVMVIACACVLLGQFSFLKSHIFISAAASRFLIGAGCAFAYIAALKLASIWLPKHYFGFAVCATDSLGMIAAVLVDSILPHYSKTHGFMASIWLVLFVGVGVLALIILLIRDRKRSIQIYHIGFNQGPLPHQRNTLKTLKMIFRNKQIWIIGIVGCFSYVPSSVFGDVWGISYLQHTYHITTQSASWTMTIMFAGWVGAGPAIGYYSDLFRTRKIPLYISYATCLILFSIVLLAPLVSTNPHPLSIVLIKVWRLKISMLDCIFFVIGICIGTHPLCFVLSKENFATKMAGTVVGVSNMLIMAGGMVFQPLVGVMLDIMSKHKGAALIASGGGFSTLSYTVALSILPISFVICLLLVTFIKETGHTLDKKAY